MYMQLLSQWVSIDTQCTVGVLSLVVHSPLDGVLYMFIFLFGNSNIVLFGKSLPISFVPAYHPGHRGVIPARGESFSP